MKKIINISLSLAFLLLMMSCQKDREVFTPIGNTVTSDIFGVVLDKEDNAVTQASVVFQGREVFTDEYGIYEFKNVELNTVHNFLTISKDGYFEGSRTFRTLKSRTIHLQTKLVEQNFNNSFQASEGASFTDGNATLRFPANAIMIEGSDEAYDGEVKLAFKYLDPTTYETLDEMPGDLTGRNSIGELSVLSSFGMVYAELESNNGEKLQIKNGSTVRMSVELPTEIEGDANATIPMWSFDYNTGLWLEEGTANLENGKFVAEVPHFSCWNYDYSAPSIVVEGRIVDQNGNGVSGVHVWISEVGQWGGGHGNTDMFGNFSGPVAKDVLLSIKVLGIGECNLLSEPIYEAEIGPFSEDTDLGEIVVQVISDEILMVSATILNCDGDPVTDGFVKVNNSYFFQIDNGNIDFVLPVCGINSYSLVAVDREAQFQSDVIPLQLDGPNNLGIISACAVETDFLTLNCPALNFMSTTNDSISISNGWEVTKLIQGGNFGGIDQFYLYMGYEDGEGQDSYAVGTFPMSQEIEFGIYDEDNPNGLWFQFLEGEVIVTEAGGIGDPVKGQFTIKALDNSTSIEYDFDGSFRLTPQ